MDEIYDDVPDVRSLWAQTEFKNGCGIGDDLTFDEVLGSLDKGCLTEVKILGGVPDTTILKIKNKLKKLRKSLTSLETLIISLEKSLVK